MLYCTPLLQRCPIARWFDHFSGIKWGEPDQAHCEEVTYNQKLKGHSYSEV